VVAVGATVAVPVAEGVKVGVTVGVFVTVGVLVPVGDLEAVGVKDGVAVGMSPEEMAGTFRFIVVPSPSWPESLLPQQYAVPSIVMPHVK